ncbi:hypothetical protein ABZX92_32450 [Lentzea sp. NPDC006480]|uniref:hypothetical protein n=1 Tax=Lentzea sp. NPDC006480 TaxID=3157176 RepID=UPI0033AED5F8
MDAPATTTVTVATVDPPSTGGVGTGPGPTRTTTKAPPPPPVTTTTSPVRRTHVAQGGNRTGSPTFADTKALTPGPRPVDFGELVEVACKAYDPTVKSANPDGYWYLLAGSPWNGQHWAAANTFTNGDELGDPNGTHHTDMTIPDCT